MRWPGAWSDFSALGLLRDTCINCLVFDEPGPEPLVAEARRKGLEIAGPASLPPSVSLIRVEWPGIKLSRSGGADEASAGPTGEPWVDSNGWNIRLNREQRPGANVWTDVAPKQSGLPVSAYLLAIADAAVYGGRWVISLDEQLARRIAAQDPEALAAWKHITNAAAFFAGHQEWREYRADAVLGVVSSISGKDEFFSHELLNLVARTNQQYRIILKSSATDASWRGLRAIMYADAEPPEADLRKQLVAFADAGGLLISGPGWGRAGARPGSGEHPRYDVFAVGKGSVAVAKEPLDDPYMAAQDAVVLMSHRYELLRFWNSGPVGSFLTVAPDERRALVQMLFYAGGPEANRTVRLARNYRRAKLWTLDDPAPREVEVVVQKDAVEVHLPPVAQYAALEFWV
jgi:hypothetical protein